MNTENHGTNSCARCRHHSEHKRPKIVDATGFDDQLEFEDVDETVYTCRNKDCADFDKEIGVVPKVDCPSFEPPSPAAGKDRLRELDEMIARREARRT